MALRVRLPNVAAPFSGDDDRVLLARFADARDEAAFAGLVGRHARMVFGVCKRAVRDEHLAEDAFQATFLVLARNPARAAAAASVGGWLFGIARRVGLAARRHEERRARRPTPERERGGNLSRPHPVADAPGSPPGFDDLLTVLDEELAALPGDCRAALVACFLEERTQDEAARQLGWSLSTLRRRLDRGKELLRVRLTRRGVTLAAGLFATGLAPSARGAVPRAVLESATPSASPSSLASALATEVARIPGLVKAAFAVAAAAALGLGGLAATSVPESREPPPNGPPAAVRPPVPRLVVAPVPAERKPWAAVRGRIVYPGDGELPKPTVVNVPQGKDAGFFGGRVLLGDVVIDPKTRGLANAVVWLRPDSDDRTAAFPPEKVRPHLAAAKAKAHRVECGKAGFTPRVVAARAGDWLVYANPTPIAFNVRYQRMATADPQPMGDDPGDFNILLPVDREHVTAPLPVLRICDVVNDSIHHWMDGYVWAFDHPYFAVTDAEGKFSIPEAPAGTWRLVVWHEKAGYRHGAKGRTGETIKIPATGTLDLKAVAHESDAWGKD